MKLYPHHWHGWPDIHIVEIDGVLYALSGWNGEKYTDCWECLDQCTPVEGSSYTLTPVYRFEVENIDLDTIEENSDEWDKAIEIVDYRVESN